jgi:ubiquinol-cytochrome c reductase iron-sulfur subunit
MSKENSRRDFLGYSFAAVAAVGVGASLISMKKAWEPVPSVLAAGFTKVDLSTLKVGVPKTVKWRGKPVFVLKKTQNMAKSPRDLVINNDRYTIAIGLCTHLGCIPAWKTDVWKCACHGGIFDASGKQTFGPPPKPLDIPMFSLNSNIITLGETGQEYNKISKALV